MRDLQLVGYTADLHHLVFTDADEGGGRFKAAIDEDFIATLDEVFKLTDPDGTPKIALGAVPPPGEEPQPADGNGEVPAGGKPGSGPLAGMAVAALRGDDSGGDDSRGDDSRGDDSPESAGPSAPATERAGDSSKSPSEGGDRGRPSRVSKLAPREIQSLLRAGMGTRAVAKQAETDEQWVRRWLAPIEGERDQVLQAVRSSYVEKARLGRSADPVGEAVRKNLKGKGIDPDDPASVQWMAARREQDSYWKVTLRYRSRGRVQRALWRFDPDTGELDPRNSLAVDVAWTRGGKGPSKAAGEADSGGTKKTAGKKTAGKKTAGKKTAGKKTAGKKTAGKKTAGKKTAGKKTAGKKTAGKKTAGKKTAGKKTAGKKTAGKKTAGKKTATRSVTKKVGIRKAAGTPAQPKKSGPAPASPEDPPRR